jgi:predicted AAA+ superfamily ATPase
MYERPVLQAIRNRISEPRAFIQVIMGPRQVGKTTLVNQLIQQIDFPALFCSADDVSSQAATWLHQQWESARLRMKTLNAPVFLLVIDEIQKIPRWSETVKSLWDEDSRNKLNLKLILLGSSRLLLQQGLNESLAGRFETWYMPHWSFREMKQAFNWDAELFAWFGGYPGSAGIIRDEMRWKNYIRNSLIDTCISRDILMLTRIDKSALLKNLFELGSSFSGQILSFNKMLGQLQDAGNTTTLSHYLHLLDTAGMLGGIEKYAAGSLRKRSSSPKFQVHNNALLSAQMKESLQEVQVNQKLWGRIVESAVGAHFLNATYGTGISLYYWREQNDEVDFVLSKGTSLIAVEVKSSGPGNAGGMNAFKKKFNPSRIYLVDNHGLSWSELLMTDPADLF